MSHRYHPSGEDWESNKEVKVKQLKVFYDCQVCGDKHRLFKKWHPGTLTSLEKFREESMEAEAKRLMLLIAKEEFVRHHPSGTFDSSRVHTTGPM